MTPPKISPGGAAPGAGTGSIPTPSPASKTIQPVAPYTIGQAAEETAEAPTEGPPPELQAAQGEAAQSQGEVETLKSELETTKQQYADKEQSESRRVAVETAIAPVRRQTEHQMAKATENLDRVRASKPTRRGAIYKIAALLEKSSGIIEPPTPFTGPQKTRGGAQRPSPQASPSSAYAGPKVRGGAQRPSPQASPTPASPYSGPQKTRGGAQSPKYQAASDVPTYSNPWNYNAEPDPVKKQQMYEQATAQSQQESQMRDRTLQEKYWSTMASPAWLDRITGLNDVTHAMSVPTPLDPTAARVQDAKTNALVAKHTGDTATETLDKAMAEAYGSRSKHQEGAIAQHEARMAAMRKERVEDGLDPDGKTPQGAWEATKHFFNMPIEKGNDMVGNFVSDGVEQFLGAGAAADDLQMAAYHRREADRAAGRKPSIFRGYHKVDSGLYGDLARNSVGAALRPAAALTALNPVGLGIRGTTAALGSKAAPGVLKRVWGGGSNAITANWLGTNRQKAQAQVDEANAAAQAEAQAKEEAAQSVSPEATPSTASQPMDFNSLMQALIPFLGMNNQYGGNNGYGQGGGDFSGQFIELMRQLGNQSRSQ